jgi:hypothetical protein
MSSPIEIVHEVEGLYRVVRLIKLRRTERVDFDLVPFALLPRISAIDRVIHGPGAFSPGPVGDVERPWYMHPFQEDNLLVLHGTRFVDLYTKDHGKVENFLVTPDRVERGGECLCEGPVMLVWPQKVFHRVQSGEEGSASANLAVHYEGFDIRTNFNIYDLDTETGRFATLRHGHEDQFHA